MIQVRINHWQQNQSQMGGIWRMMKQSWDLPWLPMFLMMLAWHCLKEIATLVIFWLRLMSNHCLRRPRVSSSLITMGAKLEIWSLMGELFQNWIHMLSNLREQSVEWHCPVTISKLGRTRLTCTFSTNIDKMEQAYTHLKINLTRNNTYTHNLSLNIAIMFFLILINLTWKRAGHWRLSSLKIGWLLLQNWRTSMDKTRLNNNLNNNWMQLLNTFKWMKLSAIWLRQRL